MLVQREIGDHAFQPTILIPQIAELAQLAHAEPAVLALPAIERGLGDLELAADLDDRRGGLGLAQGEVICSSLKRLVRMGAASWRSPGAIGQPSTYSLFVSSPGPRIRETRRPTPPQTARVTSDARGIRGRCQVQESSNKLCGDRCP